MVPMDIAHSPRGLIDGSGLNSSLKPRLRMVLTEIQLNFPGLEFLDIFRIAEINMIQFFMQEFSPVQPLVRKCRTETLARHQTSDDRYSVHTAMLRQQ